MRSDAITCCRNVGLFAVYVDMGLSSSSPVVLTAVTSGASFSRSFSVKVTQIPCTSLNKGKDRGFSAAGSGRVARMTLQIGFLEDALNCTFILGYRGTTKNMRQQT
jgi:hypothetical protein